MRRGIAAGLLAGMLAGCGIFRVPETPSLAGMAVRAAVIRARDGNWWVRATAGSDVREGRVSFVTDSTAQVGERRVRLGELVQLERWSHTDLGGRPAGFLAGGFAGALLGAFIHSFWESGYERRCGGVCTARIYLPSIAITGLAGTAIGSAVHPPHGEWVVVWKRRPG